MPKQTMLVTQKGMENFAAFLREQERGILLYPLWRAPMRRDREPWKYPRFRESAQG